MIIFVVEDERWALAELQELMSRYEPKHRVLAFDNGDDALAAAGEIRPHLVLTDINMPGIDGLELIEQLSVLDASIKCMILSVHDEFEYARQGMQFGVGDYLLKPVKKELLYKAVDKAIQQIEQELRHREDWLRGSLAQLLLSDTPGAAELHPGSELNRSACAMVLLTMEKSAQRNIPSWNAAGIDFEDWQLQLSHVLGKGSCIYAIDLDCRQKVLIAPLLKETHVSGLQSIVRRFYEKLFVLPLPVHLGFVLKPETETLRETYVQLKHSLEEESIFGMSTYFVYGTGTPEPDMLSLWDKVRLMEVHYKKGELVKGQEVLQQLLAELRQKRLTKKQIGLFIQDMLFSLKYHKLTEHHDRVSLNLLQEELLHLQDLSNYEELCGWLKEKLTDIYCVRESRELSPKGLIPLLLHHIHTHYQASISLQQFALEHHVSLGYLSRMFKSHTGTTFSDYIAGYRIRKAKELLAGGVDRLQEVSQLVGYEDTKHFSALFKKIVGETPMMYAKKQMVRK